MDSSRIEDWETHNPEGEHWKVSNGLCMVHTPCNTRTTYWHDDLPILVRKGKTYKCQVCEQEAPEEIVDVAKLAGLYVKVV
jgi:hypothetical protein